MVGWISETWLLCKMKPMTKRKGELHGTGHTNFSPDACFGLIKRKFRCSDVRSLDDLARVVNEYAAYLCQLVSTQDGTTYTIVSSRAWAGLLFSHFAFWMVSRSTVTSALSTTIQEDCHNRGGDAMLAVGCVVTISGGQTYPSTCNRTLFRAKEVPLL